MQQKFYSKNKYLTTSPSHQGHIRSSTRVWLVNENPPFLPYLEANYVTQPRPAFILSGSMNEE